MTMERAYPAIRGVYSLVGSTDRVSAQVFDFPHNYNQTSRNAVYAAMGRWLLGIDDPDQTREGKQQPEKPEDLFTFDSGHPAPSNRKTPEQLEDYSDRDPATAARRHRPFGRSRRDGRPGAGLLLTSLKVRTGVVNPPPESLDSREVRRLPLEEFTVVHTLLGRTATGEAIPVVRLIPAHPSGRLTVIAHPRGKAALATGSGEPTALVQALLARGHEVVGFDPLFVGESLDPRDPVPHRPEAVHFETYNPAPAAEQMQDLATVLAWCRAQEDVREVNLIAQDTAGYQALVARPVLEGLARTVDRAGGPAPGRRPSPTSGRRRSTCPASSSSAVPGPPPPSSAPAPLWLYGNIAALSLRGPSPPTSSPARLRCCEWTDGRPGPRRDRALDRSRRVMTLPSHDQRPLARSRPLRVSGAGFQRQGAETVPRLERSERRVASGIADQPEERQLIEGRRGRMPDQVGEAIERLQAVLALGLQLDDGLLVQRVGQVEHRDDALGVDAAGGRS